MRYYVAADASQGVNMGGFMSDGYRVKIAVKDILPQRTWTKDEGGAPVIIVEFTGLNPSGVQNKYTIFGKTELFSFAKAGAVIDAEVVDKPGKPDNEGNPRTNHNIMQIYVNDKPVIQPQQKGRWQPRQDNPEQRRSIERQVSAKLALEFSPQPTLLGKLFDAEVIYCWIAGDKLPAESKDTTKPVQALPATTVTSEGSPPAAAAAATVYAILVKMVEAKLVRWAQIAKEIIARGGHGQTATLMVQSLPADKLADLLKWAETFKTPANSAEDIEWK